MNYSRLMACLLASAIAAFMPTLFIDGGLSVFGEAIGFVVVFCLLFSLVESLLILPAQGTTRAQLNERMNERKKIMKIHNIFN